MKKLIGLGALLGVAGIATASTGRLTALFSADYVPHRFCYLAKPGLIWTNVVLDSVIAASYALIFGSLMWIAYRFRLTSRLDDLRWILLAFGTFIFACGGTHVMEVVTIWWPVYPLSAAVKVVCAAASVTTAVLFVVDCPKLVANILLFMAMDAELRKENGELADLSHRDALTGLTNRGKFDMLFDVEWQRAIRTGVPISAVMLDVDHFKLLNDSYGHQAGDKCLRRVAELLNRRSHRPNDVTARYGGDEFVLLLPGSSLVSTCRIAENIRVAVAALEIPNEDSSVVWSVTMSIGVASAVPKFHENPHELLAAADLALYEAKRKGRNRIEPDCDFAPKA